MYYIYIYICVCVYIYVCRICKSIFNYLIIQRTNGREAVQLRGRAALSGSEVRRAVLPLAGRFSRPISLGKARER